MPEDLVATEVESQDDVTISERVQQLVDAKGETGAEAGDDDTPSYEPNYAYTVKDEERSFDERFHPLVKTKEDEDFIRDLHTRADGLSGVKERLDFREREYTELYGHSKELTQGYAALMKYRDGGDVRGLQKALGLNDDFVINWGLTLAEEEELPAETKELIRKNRELEQQKTVYESQLSQHTQTSDDQLIENDVRELESYVRSDEYAPLVEAMKKNNLNFMDTVVMTGSHHYQMNNVELGIKDVCNMVKNQYAFMVPTVTETTQMDPNLSGTKTVVVQQHHSLPTLNGSNTTAVKQPVRSLEDLKKLRDSIDY